MISTHILDTSLGAPAAGVGVNLQIKTANGWKQIATGLTNTDGRFSFDCEKIAGVYQIIFEIESYFKNSARDSFFMNTPVIFKIENTGRKYHVPLLLNPFGFST
jgi:5-hydroxyisourate hydrolase